MVSLGQKLKMPKTCEKSFYRNNRVFLCKNRFKKHQIFQKSDNFENRHNAKGIAHAKAISFPNGQVGSKIENLPKTCEKPFFKNIRVVLCKKPLGCINS